MLNLRSQRKAYFFFKPPHPVEAAQLVAPVLTLTVAVTPPPGVDAPLRRRTLEHAQWAHTLCLGAWGKRLGVINQSINQQSYALYRLENLFSYVGFALELSPLMWQEKNIKG